MQYFKEFTPPTVPKFQDKKFDVRDFGASEDDIKKNTSAFSAAIEECSRLGGGREHRTLYPLGNSCCAGQAVGGRALASRGVPEAPSRRCPHQSPRLD